MTYRAAEQLVEVVQLLIYENKEIENICKQIYSALKDKESRNMVEQAWYEALEKQLCRPVE